MKQHVSVNGLFGVRIVGTAQVKDAFTRNEFPYYLKPLNEVEVSVHCEILPVRWALRIRDGPSAFAKESEAKHRAFIRTEQSESIEQQQKNKAAYGNRETKNGPG